MEIEDVKDIHQLKSVLYKNTVEALFQSIEKKGEEDPESAETAVFEDIIHLSDLLGEVVERALSLIDNVPIKIFRSQHSKRELIEIQGETRPYWLFPNLPYCCCQSFFKQVIQGIEYCCKHYIASRIAKALGKVEVIEIPMLEFRQMIKKIKF